MSARGTTDWYPIRHWILDVEGTLVIDKRYEPVAGAVEWLNRLKADDHAVRILTNNTTLTTGQVAEGLRERGFDVADEEVFSGQSRAAEILKEEDMEQCWVLGSEALLATLTQAGISVHDLREETPPASADRCAVVIGYLTEVSAPLLGRAVELLLQPEITFITLHSTRLFKNKGRLEPGLGAWVAALEYASGRTAVVAGKPSPELFLTAAESLGVPHSKIAMVGDDPLGDVAPAMALGMRGVMVLSGKYSDRGILSRTYPDFHPDLLAESVAEIPVPPTR